MNTLATDCPAIHVTFTAMADQGLFPWVRVGAEEEGVPCRRLSLHDPVDVVALAFAAARSSRLNIGVALDRSEIVLHEVHMPAQKPVLRFRFDGRAPAVCRLLGGNAARMVVRLPFRFPGEDEAPVEVEAPPVRAEAATRFQAAMEMPPSPEPEPLDTREVARIVAIVVRKLAERGI